MEEIFSGLIGAIVGAFGACLTLRFNYRQLFAENVSKSRMQWIDNFREELSIILGVARLSKAEKSSKYDLIYKAEKARVKLLTRLNLNTKKYGNEFNELFQDKLRTLKFDESYTEEELFDIIEISRKILEHEWKIVKNEAKGKGYK